MCPSGLPHALSKRRFAERRHYAEAGRNVRFHVHPLRFERGSVESQRQGLRDVRWKQTTYSGFRSRPRRNLHTFKYVLLLRWGRFRLQQLVETGDLF